MVLDKINEPKDLKKLSTQEMEELAKDIRKAILNRVSKIGGHVGSNLGIVETTIALHYVFNSPIDKIVFDVSHQCYTHKILTGRKNGFLNEEEFSQILGYTNPNESEHDIFRVGHTSTSISLACGLAKARDLKNETANIIALIGDGSLSGGEAFEGLNNVAELNSNFIIIVNDNDMSIAPNYGGIYKNLKQLRETEGKAECNFFKALGFDYCYVRNGNNLAELIQTFEKVKDTNHPIVVHIHTLKGKGLLYAERDKEAWHWSNPFEIEDGKKKIEEKAKEQTYKEITANYLEKKAKEDKKIVLITPATPGACGLTPEIRKRLDDQFVDVGIAEEHAIAYASGLAKNGAKPIVTISSSFMQRTYDQLAQDLAMNPNGAVVLVYGNGISSKDMTHFGGYDIPLISNIPNILYLAPTCLEEYLSMLEWGIEQKEKTIMIRVPNGNVLERQIVVEKDYANGEYKIEEKGKEIAIIALGNFYRLGKKLKNKLKEELGIDATLINPRYISGIDTKLLENLKLEHKLIVTIEDGVLEGGFGEKISRFYGTSNKKVMNFGARKELIDKVPLQELYERYHLTEDWMVADIKNVLE